MAVTKLHVVLWWKPMLADCYSAARLKWVAVLKLRVELQWRMQLWRRLMLKLNLCSSLGDGGRGSRWVVVNTDAELKCNLLLKLTLS